MTLELVFSAIRSFSGLSVTRSMCLDPPGANSNKKWGLSWYPARLRRQSCRYRFSKSNLFIHSHPYILYHLKLIFPSFQLLLDVFVSVDNNSEENVDEDPADRYGEEKEHDGCYSVCFLFVWNVGFEFFYLSIKRLPWFSRSQICWAWL